MTTLINFVLWWVVISVVIISTILLSIFIMYKYPHSKLGTWIRNYIITDEDPEQPSENDLNQRERERTLDSE